MKEQVTDMSKVLRNMAEEMRLMRETINEQYTEIAKLNRNIEALNRQIRKKEDENAILRDRLSGYENPGRNSGNSSTPPGKESMKDQIVRRTRTLRKPSGKKPGGQEEPEGHRLSCSSMPDETIDDTPDYCTNCGESLAETERVLDYVTQVISIPELKPVIKEIRHYVMVRKNCGGRIRTAPRQRSNYCKETLVFVECGCTFGIGVNSQIRLHLAMLPKIGILHTGNLGSHLAVIARRQHNFKSGKHDKQTPLFPLRYHLLIHFVCYLISKCKVPKK